MNVEPFNEEKCHESIKIVTKNLGVSENWSNFDTSKLGYISKNKRKLDFPLVFYSICTNFAPRA